MILEDGEAAGFPTARHEVFPITSRSAPEEFKAWKLLVNIVAAGFIELQAMLRSPPGKQGPPGFRLLVTCHHQDNDDDDEERDKQFHSLAGWCEASRRVFHLSDGDAFPGEEFYKTTAT